MRKRRLAGYAAALLVPFAPLAAAVTWEALAARRRRLRQDRGR